MDASWKDRDGKRISLVLVFDQFEELFTRGQVGEGGKYRTAPLLTELADLVENRAPAVLEQQLEENPELVKNFVFDRQDFSGSCSACTRGLPGTTGEPAGDDAGDLA